jgi:hypothetical protein
MKSQGEAAHGSNQEPEEPSYFPKPYGYVPTTTDIDAVLEVLPTLEGTPNDLWYSRMGDGLPDEEGVITVVRIISSERIYPIIRALIKHGFVQDFDWMQWGEEAKRFESPILLAEANLQTCVKLLTTYARAERFIDGFMADMISSGQVTRVLLRLRAIRG